MKSIQNAVKSTERSHRENGGNRFKAKWRVKELFHTLRWISLALVLPLPLYPSAFLALCLPPSLPLSLNLAPPRPIPSLHSLYNFLETKHAHSSCATFNLTWFRENAQSSRLKDKDGGQRYYTYIAHRVPYNSIQLGKCWACLLCECVCIDVANLQFKFVQESICWCITLCITVFKHALPNLVARCLRPLTLFMCYTSVIRNTSSPMLSTNLYNCQCLLYSQCYTPLSVIPRVSYINSVI